MKYFEFELKDGKLYKLRLTAENACQLEEKTKTKLLDYISDYSVNTIINLLMYCMRAEDPTSNKTKASKLFDDLADNGYALEDMIDKIIYPTLVISGFLKHAKLQEQQQMEEKMATIKEKVDNQIDQVIQRL